MMIYYIFTVLLATLSLATPTKLTQKRMLDRFNSVRIQAGLRPVAFSESLTAIAFAHSQVQSKAYKNFRAGTSQLQSAAAAVGLAPKFIGEAESLTGTTSAATALEMMMAPEADPKNIKDIYNPNITHIGADFVRLRTEFYWTLIVARL